MNPRLKQIMKELGDAINTSVSESESIARIIARLKDEGYEIFLALQATVGFNRRNEDGDQPDAVSVETDRSLQATLAPQFAINASDIRFLKALRINGEGAS